MAEAADVLTLTQVFSPGFPVGAFSYSHGLEWEIEAGRVADAGALRAWIEAVLRFGAGSSDAVFLYAAYQVEGEALAALDALARAYQPSKERLAETDLQGAAFCDAVRAGWGVALDGLTYPVAAGRAARLLDLPVALTAAQYLQAFVANLASVGMRLIPLGQSDGQAIIRDLGPVCLQIAKDAAGKGLEDLSSTVFLADIAAMRHESQYSRSFRT